MFQCNICNFQATQKGGLSKHIENVHHKSENIVCTECNKTIQKRHLPSHIKLFHSGGQTQLNCNICTFQTIHASSLKKHVKNVHQKFLFQNNLP